MATGNIIFLPQGACLPDGSASNAAPGISRWQGSETSPKKHYWTLDFDPTADEHSWFPFRMPTDFASAPVVKILWITADSTAAHDVVWGAWIHAITAADADTPQEHANASAATTATTSVNTTEAGRLIETSITLANVDTVAAGDLVYLLIYRDADNGADDCTSDAQMICAALEYTTT